MGRVVLSRSSRMMSRYGMPGFTCDTATACPHQERSHSYDSPC